MAKARQIPETKWIRPVTGVLDNRSNPDLMIPGAVRMRQNFHTPDPNKLVRSGGWTKYGNGNSDLHDQLLVLQTYYAGGPDSERVFPGDCEGELQVRDTGRQPITMMFQATSSSGVRRLIVGTESRLYAGYEYGQNYKIIGDGYGQGTDDGTAPKIRFRAAQNGDYVLFTNDYDDILSWQFDAPTLGCALQAVHPIPDLLTFQIRKAKAVWSWQGVSFIANVEVGGVRYLNRIYWSDKDDPLSWDPGKLDSIAGFQDLDPGEEIVDGIELGQYFLIFTNKRIWIMGLVGQVDQPFSFDKKYTPTKTGEACLFYRNTLCSIGDEVVYAGRDGMYRFSVFSQAPERLDWIHAGTAVIFNDISNTWCESHCAAFNASDKSIYFSWTPKLSTTGLNDRTFVIDTAQRTCHTIDHGFTAFCNSEHNVRKTVYDFLISNCICTPSELGQDGQGLAIVKQGLPQNIPTNCPALGPLYTTVEVTIDGATVEDWTQAQPSANSVCALIEEMDCDPCPQGSVFAGACSVDWCIKEFDQETFSRERCTNTTAVGENARRGYTSSIGTYVLDGYDSILRSGAETFDQRSFEKEFTEFLLDILPEIQTTPSPLYVRVGVSARPVDPNNDGVCPLLWEVQEVKYLDCGDSDVSVLEDNNQRPTSGPMKWPLYRRGQCLYWEIKISGTGGACQISAIGQTVGLRFDNKL